MVPVVPPAATVRSSDALKLGDSPAIVPLYWPSRAVGPVTPESFLHAAPDATSTSAVALRSRLTGRMGMPSFVESVIRRSGGARATKRESAESEATLPLPPKNETGRVDPCHSAGLAICSPRGMGDPHDSAPRGAWHLSCVPICPCDRGTQVGDNFALAQRARRGHHLHRQGRNGDLLLLGRHRGSGEG